MVLIIFNGLLTFNWDLSTAGLKSLNPINQIFFDQNNIDQQIHYEQFQPMGADARGLIKANSYQIQANENRPITQLIKKEIRFLISFIVFIVSHDCTESANAECYFQCSKCKSPFALKY